MKSDLEQHPFVGLYRRHHGGTLYISVPQYDAKYLEDKAGKPLVGEVVRVWVEL